MDIFSDDDPFQLFERWLGAASRAESKFANACALASIGEDMQPDIRMVLLKEHGRGGFVFYTNMESAKAEQLRAHPKGALCFYWKSIDRQVRIQGPVAPVSEAEAEAYFATRPRRSQIGAWASAQSRPLKSRQTLIAKFDKLLKKYSDQPVPKPSYWGGWTLRPTRFEFWRNQESRLHERKIFFQEGKGADWRTEWLYP